MSAWDADSELQAELWPLAFDDLEKGEIISAEHIEHVATLNAGHRVVRGTDEYNLACMQLQSAIRQKRPELRTRRDRHNIRVLLDAEYAEHTTRQTVHGLRKILRASQLPAPDPEALTAQQRDAFDRSHARALRLRERVLQSEREAAAEAQRLAAAAQRLTPKNE